MGFCIGEFHFSDADVLNWTYDEYVLFAKYRKDVIESLKKTNTPKKGGKQR